MRGSRRSSQNLSMAGARSIGPTLPLLPRLLRLRARSNRSLRRTWRLLAHATLSRSRPVPAHRRFRSIISHIATVLKGSTAWLSQAHFCRQHSPTHLIRLNFQLGRTDYHPRLLRRRRKAPRGGRARSQRRCAGSPMPTCDSTTCTCPDSQTLRRRSRHSRHAVSEAAPSSGGDDSRAPRRGHRSREAVTLRAESVDYACTRESSRRSRSGSLTNEPEQPLYVFAVSRPEGNGGQPDHTCVVFTAPATEYALNTRKAPKLQLAESKSTVAKTYSSTIPPARQLRRRFTP